MTRRVPLIVVALALLLTAAFWFLLFRPRAEEEAGYRDEAAQLQAQAVQLQGRIATLQDVEANADEYRARLARLAEYIPGDPAQPSALRELQRSADQSGVEIVEMTYADAEAVTGAPATGDAKTALATIPTQVTVEGGYFQVVDLLRRVEVDMGRALKVGTVSMAEAEDGFPQISATWTGEIFAVLPLADLIGEDGAAAPAPAQPAPAEGSEAPTTAPDAEGAAPDGTQEGTS